MRKWTDKQQQQLDELLKAKEHARARLQDDIDHLLDRTAGGIGGPVSEYLMAYGQVALDMLIVHFEPTPQPGNPAGIYTPEDFIPLADAVALSKHG